LVKKRVAAFKEGMLWIGNKYHRFNKTEITVRMLSAFDR
jgi:hypothetical protein